MKLNKVALGLAITFFVIWFAFAYAIADHPVPAGFFWVPLTLAVAAGLVYWRVPVYQQRIVEGKTGRYWLAVLEGLAAGLVIAAIISLRPVEPQPGLPERGVWDYLVIFILMGILGMFNTGAIHILSGLFLNKKA